MVVGGTDVGKTTLCRLLLNYGVRLGRRPVFIDLDVGQQSIGIPGSIGALMVERPADPVEGFDMKAPIVYHYGHTTPNANFKLYSALITRIQDLYNNKCHYNQKVHHSGCIINTCGWVNRKGYDTLLETAKTFEADVVLCLDAERLYQDLVRDLPDFVNIMLLKKVHFFEIKEDNPIFVVTWSSYTIKGTTPRSQRSPRSRVLRWSSRPVLPSLIRCSLRQH